MHCRARWARDMLHSTSAILRLGTQSRPQVARSVPSPHSVTPQQCETCQLTPLIGTLAEGSVPYTISTQYTIHDLTAETINSTHTHRCVQHSLTQSLQCPGVMPDFVTWG